MTSEINMKKIDIIKAVAEGKMKETEAKVLYERCQCFKNNPPCGKLLAEDFLMLSIREASGAYMNVPFGVLADWRRNGWPKKCSLCGKPVRSQYNFWIRKVKGEYRFLHHDCFLEEMFVKAGASWKNPKKRKIDIVELVDRCIFTEIEADQIMENITSIPGHDEAKDRLDIVGLTEMEGHAYFMQFEFSTIARWRKYGWSGECVICGKPVDFKEYMWKSIILRNKRWLIHLECSLIFREQELAEQKNIRKRKHVKKYSKK